MTTTKLIYLVAAVVPGGFILLACLGILHVVRVGLRERQQRQAAVRLIPDAALPRCVH